MKVSTFSYFYWFSTFYKNGGTGVENCYRTADWSPYRSLLELKDKNKTLFRLLHDDEILFLMIPATECSVNNCRIEYSELGCSIIPRSDRDLFFQLVLKFGKKHKFKKCTLEQFFELDFRYHFNQYGNLHPNIQWLDLMSDYFTDPSVKANFVLLPLQWFYDARSISWYKKRLVAYHFSSTGQSNWKGEPIPADLRPTTGATEFFFIPSNPEKKVEL